MTFESCNPSAVWSDDSKFLAVPQWRTTQRQRILVISIERATFGYTADIFELLELHSFSAGKIKGIDLPGYKPREIEIDLREIRWNVAETATCWQRLISFIGFA
jgi:hypothetical protein